MKNVIVVLPVLAMLGACGSKPTVEAHNASVAEVAAGAKEAVKMQPGKWQTAVKIVSIDAPGMPDQVANAMRQQMSAMGTRTVESCLTPEMAAKPPETMFSGAAKDCRYEKFEMTGGKLDGTLVCHTPAGEVRSTTAGKFTTTSFDVTSESTMTMPAMPGVPIGTGGGKVNTKTQVTGKRLGECDAAKAG